MEKKKWELAAMTAVTAFLMLETKAEALDDAHRALSLVSQKPGFIRRNFWIRTGSVCLRMTLRRTYDLTSVIKKQRKCQCPKQELYVLSLEV